jgi:hypothetical protein
LPPFGTIARLLRPRGWKRQSPYVVSALASVAIYPPRLGAIALPQGRFGFSGLGRPERAAPRGDQKGLFATFRSGGRMTSTRASLAAMRPSMAPSTWSSSGSITGLLNR